jgi:hypothetical protein
MAATRRWRLLVRLLVCCAGDDWRRRRRVDAALALAACQRYCSGERLKEASCINVSLSALGQVTKTVV